jgi:hypothetical protein
VIDPLPAAEAARGAALDSVCIRLPSGLMENLHYSPGGRTEIVANQRATQVQVGGAAGSFERATLGIDLPV